ncbi:MAG: phosphoribosylformylglycinamidine cyclo-ligase, partial [Spirochaetaceae bacterium]|nr:phosphoribosylformylglycinamidine cyclo-ligase [Spirochaetaceae bacterium]
MSDNEQVPAAGYKDAGVDKAEGYRAVEKMKASVAATQGPQVLGGLGAFASLYSMEGWSDPVLVAGTDGVGTKLRLALDAGKLDVIGRDCYAMVANDILCHGAKPLFFLDYIACGKLEAEKAAGIVAGMADACGEDGCALVGGETAEMPG